MPSRHSPSRPASAGPPLLRPPPHNHSTTLPLPHGTTMAHHLAKWSRHDHKCLSDQGRPRHQAKEPQPLAAVVSTAVELAACRLGWSGVLMVWGSEGCGAAPHTSHSCVVARLPQSHVKQTQWAVSGELSADQCAALAVPAVQPLCSPQAVHHTSRYANTGVRTHMCVCGHWHGICALIGMSRWPQRRRHGLGRHG